MSGLFSCKKDLQSVGADFAKSRNGLNPQFDTTIELSAYTVRMDSVATNHLTSYAIGSINDPVFGITKASIIMQVTLPSSSWTWGAGVNNLDSLVLQLRFRSEPMFDGTYLKDYYGDKDAIHTLKVYELTDDLNWDSLYYCRRKPSYNASAPIGSWIGKFNFTDTTQFPLGINKIKEVIPPNVRIVLDTAFRNRFYNADKAGNFTSIATFKIAFKGFVVVDETIFGPDQGSVAFVRLNTDATSLTAYHDSVPTYFYTHGSTEAAYNYYEQVFKDPDLIQIPFKGQHKNIGYVQPLGGTKVRIEFPNLFTNSKLINPKITINGAQLVVPVLSASYSDKYNLPLSMLLHGSDSLGRNVLILDEFDPAYYDGSLNTNYNEYQFNIARHLQFLLNEHKKGNDFNYGLNLVVSAFSPVSAQRVLFDTNKNNKFKLKLTYTVVK